MDKFEQLLTDSQFSMVILGNEEHTDFVLVEDRPWSDELQSDIARRGLRFAGVLGIVKGKPQCALAVPMDEPTILRLSQQFVARAETDENVMDSFVGHIASIAFAGQPAN